MRVTFPRLPDHQRAYALVERDDGVVCRLDEGVAGPRLPHDIMSLVVERELRIRDGIWAGIAAGAAFTSERGRRAEFLADLVWSAAALETMTQDKIRQLARAKLAALRRADEDWAGGDWAGGDWAGGDWAGGDWAEVDPVVIAAAARALQVEAARWARLRVGEELTYEWPGK